MKRACLGDVAYHLPENILDNEELVKKIPSLKSSENIFAKTGVRERHIAAKNECASELAIKAAEKLFAKNPQLRDKIDFIIFCTQSPDYALPTTACLLQDRLNLSTNCGAVDVNQGCSGFVYGLFLTKSLIESGLAENVLLLTSETYSKYIADDDKSTRPIFGDGAAATWITAKSGDTEFISNFVLGTDGRGAENLIYKGVGTNLYMNGPEIFQFVLKVVPKTIKRILEQNQLNLEEIDYFIFHQANAFMLNHLRTKLKIPEEKFCMDLEEIGNTVSASIPIALSRALMSGVVKHDDKILLMGFGVGYSWGGCILTL